MVKLNDDEKKLIVHVLKHQLEEVKKTEKYTDTWPSFLAAEVKYDEFISDLIAKLEK